jgi:hypothetical protein
MESIARSLEGRQTAQPPSAPSVPLPAAPVAAKADAAPTQPEAEAAAAPVKRGRGRPPKTDTAAPAPATPSAAPPPAATAEPAKPTKDDVRAALTAAHGRIKARLAAVGRVQEAQAETVKVLRDAAGVDNLSALTDDKFQAVIAAANAAN